MRTEMKPGPAQPHAPQFLIAAAHTTAALALTCVFAFAAAMAQTPAADAPPPAPADAAAAPPPQNAAGAFGTWVQQGVASMGAGFGEVVGVIGGQANQATRDAADAARNTAASVSKLPNTGITAGNERCAIAPNGAPDCRIAAETLCRAKGYAGGNSVDFITVENCPPPWRTSRRSAPDGVCAMEHYVTKALCQ